MQPDLLFKSQHVTAVFTATGPTCCRPWLLARRHTSDGGIKSPDPRPDLAQVQLFDFEVPPLERLAAAWPSHPIHVSTLTSPNDQLGAYILDWLCDNIHPVGPVEDSDAARTLRAYVGYVLDAECGGERMFGWLVNAYDGGPLSDVPLEGGWNVGRENRSESTLVTVRIQMDPLAFLEGPWHGHSHVHGHCPGVALNLDGPASSQTRAQDGRTWIQPSAVDQVQDPYEAHGVGVIIKALVQQNAGASLFLRTMMVCVAVLCLVHSTFVLGDRPSHLGRRKS